MKIGITGSRHLQDTPENYLQLHQAFMKCLQDVELTLEGISVIVHGGCKTGVDAMLHRLAHEVYHLPTTVYEPVLDPYTSFAQACHKRNQRIIDEVTYLFAFFLRGAKNKGTTDTVRRGRAKPLNVVSKILTPGPPFL